MTLSKAATALIASTAALITLPAMAGTSSEPGVKQLNVSVAGYDLTKSADAQIVYYKIQKAAKRVCRNSLVRETLRERMEELECREDAIESAAAQLDAPTLTFVMHERTRTS